MGKKVTFSVTKKDIKNGKPTEGSNCPVFFALKRVLPELVFVDVDTFDCELEGLEWWENNKRYYKVPRKIKNWIVKFDKDKKSVKPFTHTLILREL